MLALSWLCSTETAANYKVWTLQEPTVHGHNTIYFKGTFCKDILQIEHMR